MRLIDLLKRFGRRRDEVNVVPPRGRYYHAVSVMPAAGSCPQAIAIRDIRYLSREAPTLPLRDCAWPHRCHCRFAKYEDRRQDDRRDIASSGRWYAGPERRKTRGRRLTDR